MILNGSGVSKGIVIGRIFVYKPFTVQVKETRFSGSAEDELLKYEHAVQCARDELESCRKHLEKTEMDKAHLFSAHEELLCDTCVDEDIRDAVVHDRVAADYAIDSVFSSYAAAFAKSKSPVIRERVSDMNDVKLRLLRVFYGIKEKNIASLASPVIIACHDLLPSDTATMDRDNVIGILTEAGGETSHSAIIAKSRRIPAILGISGLLDSVYDDETVILDALTGKVFTEPSAELVEAYKKKNEAFLAARKETDLWLDRKAVTADGQEISIGLNIGSASDDELENLKHTDYIGLFRSEFLYMGKSDFPDEDMQFAEYKKVLVAADGAPVTLRTLDIGGDKTLKYWKLPQEDNPFLGCRAIRLCFRHEDIFRIQLRAALRASVYGNLQLMFPMIGSLDDIRKAKGIVESVKAELAAEKIPYRGTVGIGIMIEIPSIALIADQVAREVDFASLGTNDLCQYLLACDRVNPGVAGYYQNFHPALFRLIGYAAQEFARAGKPLGVCGELGGNPLAVPVLAGLGITKFSMGIASVPVIKKTLASFSVEEMQRLAAHVRNSGTAEETEQYLKEQITAASV